MKIVRNNVGGYRVIDLATGKTKFTGVSYVDCEQYVFAASMRKRVK